MRRRLCCLLLSLSLSSHGRHGFCHSFLVSQELPLPQGLQVLIQLVQNGDSCRQVQLHYGFIGHSYRGQHIWTERLSWAICMRFLSLNLVSPQVVVLLDALFFTMTLDSTESWNTGKINILRVKINAKLKDYVTLLLNENVKNHSLSKTIS